MPSLHLIGELLGASDLFGLSNQESFSVSYVLNLLWRPSSTQLSYFCKWRLVVNDLEKNQNQSINASWKIIQGNTQGQTQVHAASSGGSLAMPDLYRQNNKHVVLPKMDTVWAHPIDLHLATTGTNTWNCWPRLEFQVLSLDGFQLETLCGSATISIPMSTNEYVLDVPLVHPERPSMLGSLARAVGLPINETFKERNSEQIVRGTGKLYLRFAVLCQDL